VTTNGTNGSSSSSGKKSVKIGVYVCHCGTNISGKVNVSEVAAFAKALPGVVISREYKFMCSDPGQILIQDDIKNLKLDRIVVASCSPLMHEPTFRGACERADMNRYLFQMANIREHCSWVTVDTGAATEKAKMLVAAAVAKATLLTALPKKTVSVNQAALVVGGGIAGIQAALDIAESGRKVFLVEKQPSIGGHMAMFDKTFPTLDCAACILTPKMVQAGKHPNITLISSAEVEEVKGFVGNFKVKVRRKAIYVDHDKCTGCGMCWESCPARTIPARRVIRKGKLVIGRTASAPAGGGNGAAAAGKGHA
jgi:heterodisulfide reductase subunit A2